LRTPRGLARFYLSAGNSIRAPSIRVVRFFYFLTLECAMRLKRTIFFLLSLTFLAACKDQPISSPMPPAVKPSITGLAAREVDQATAGAIRSHLGPYIRSNPFTESESGSQLLLYLVSSGEFGQAEIILASGETYHADVLYAYALMVSQRVLVAPVVVGLVLPDGGYVYFSEKYAFEAEGGITAIGADRGAAMADALARLPRGRIFRLLLYNMATHQGLDWNKCPSISFYSPEICSLGELVEELFPGQTRTFVLRLSDEIPANWLLLAWVFQEFAVDELVPGASIDVTLPEPSQPQE
jgi:hypothetical protein